MTLLPNCYGSTTFYETIDRFGTTDISGILSPKCRNGNREPLIIERGKGPYLIDTKGKRYLDGTSFHLGQSPWPSPSGARPCDQEAAGQGRTFNAVRTLQSTGDSARASIDSNRTQWPDTCVLFRQWVDSGRSRAQNGGAVLAASDRPTAGPKHTFLHLKLAYHGDTIGAVSVGNIELFPFAIQVAAVPHRRSRPSLLLSLPA